MKDLRKWELEECLWEWGHVRIEGTETRDELRECWRYLKAYREYFGLPTLWKPQIDHDRARSRTPAGMASPRGYRQRGFAATVR